MKDCPLRAQPHSGWTRAHSINLFGAITGTFSDGTRWHGFVRDPKGDVTAFDPPGSVLTWPYSINITGTVTGYFSDGSRSHGFVRDRNGSITVIDAPASPSTVPVSINDFGGITGEADFDGFVRDPAGNFSIFDPPGSQRPVQPSSINGLGWVAGNFPDITGGLHGFLRAPNGTFSVFDMPGGPGTDPATFPYSLTYADAINAGGVIAGRFLVYDAGDVAVSHGFVREPSGHTTIFDVPGSSDTNPSSINALGTVTGFFIAYPPDAGEGTTLGFVRNSAGELAVFDAPQRKYQAIFPLSLNDVGYIAGIIWDGTRQRGFVRDTKGHITIFDGPGLK